MDDTQSNRPDNLGDISDSGLILLKAKLVLAAIRYQTVPAHIRDHAVQRPKMVTTPNLAAVPRRYQEAAQNARCFIALNSPAIPSYADVPKSNQ